jgi:hypothetical protein
MVTDGPCLTGTLENLAAGYGAQALPPTAVAQIKKDALALLELVLHTYEEGVAKGEVGAKGTRTAASAKPLAAHCPTGLLYGRVQSGKTVAMIASCAAAMDNGFRVAIVLTSDFLKLVEQTARRFAALYGPLVKDSTTIENWEPDLTHIKKQIRDHGLVLVCQKNQAHLRTLVEFLENVGAGEYPSLILDDEADQATLDTTTAARAAGRPNAPSVPSAIHRHTVKNEAPLEEGESVRERLPHHVFLQVTATPYALLLQDFDDPLRPKFTKLLEPGEGYTGGEAFFDAPLVEEERPPLVFVDDDESARIQARASETPQGLQQAIAFFLVTSAAQAVLTPALRALGQNFLCHTSPKTSEHDQVATLIRTFLSKVLDDIGHDDVPGEVGVRLGWAYDELKRTLSGAPEFVEVREMMRRRLPRREVLIVNSANSPAEFGPQLNFIVGGNILGRGLTIENLLVTYYLRRSKISQMDTVLQHARMFGYRRALMPFTRVFLPESLAFRFHGIHEAERRLRERLLTADPRSRIPVETVPGLRATRPNVLDARSLSAYGPGEQVYPVAPLLDGAAVLSKNRKVEAALKVAFGGALQPSRFVEVEMGTLVDLMNLVPYADDDAGNWDPDTLGRILRSVGKRYANKGALFYRQMDRRKKRLATGAASGTEVQEAQALGRPVLFVFRDTGKYLGKEFWYPTIVLPLDLPTQVFNIT